MHMFGTTELYTLHAAGMVTSQMRTLRRICGGARAVIGALSSEGAPISREMRVFSLLHRAAHPLHHMLGRPQSQAKQSNHEAWADYYPVLPYFCKDDSKMQMSDREEI